MFVQNHHTHTHTHTPSHTIFHRTPSFTHNFHIQLSNCSILHHLLCLCLLSLRTTSSFLTLTRFFSHRFFTRNIVTHHLSHTSLSHTISHTQLVHTTLHIQPFNSWIVHHLVCLSCLPRPAGTLCFCLLEEVDLWGYLVLYFFKYTIGLIPDVTIFDIFNYTDHLSLVRGSPGLAGRSWARNRPPTGGS